MRHLYNASNFKRPLETGDVISVKGKEEKIVNILRQDYYVCVYNPELSYIDIDFTTKNGTMHRWKSHIDGGFVLYHDKVFKNCAGVDVTDIFRKYGYR